MDPGDEVSDVWNLLVYSLLQLEKRCWVYGTHSYVPCCSWRRGVGCMEPTRMFLVTSGDEVSGLETRCRVYGTHSYVPCCSWRRGVGCMEPTRMFLVTAGDEVSDVWNLLICSLLQLETRCCQGCGENILDKFLLLVNDRSWHGDCLRCCICRTSLDDQTSCFIRDNRIYCKGDYVRSFGAKCSKCSRGISASDWVRKARDHVYHLACFACDACKRQLSTGEEFALHEDRVLCKTHYLEVVDGGRSSADAALSTECYFVLTLDTADSESHSGSSGNRSKTKRVRTTFTDEQLQVLQANFQLDSNPDGQDLERIAQITGLSKRVTQVWFQNSRARQKKHSTIVAQQTDGNIHILPHHRFLAHQLHHSGECVYQGRSSRNDSVFNFDYDYYWGFL
uniref:Arrowhead n=1 Tax=Timema shepardi TaxID=629360 RepID=A0A7R9AM35_TIMSH|nr:unnamed protein product [Timema shepardi]